MQKRALFETFVDKVVAYKDGKIVVNVDVFGTKAKIESIDGVVNGVRTEKLVLRHDSKTTLAKGLYLKTELLQYLHKHVSTTRTLF